MMMAQEFYVKYSTHSVAGVETLDHCFRVKATVMLTLTNEANWKRQFFAVECHL